MEPEPSDITLAWESAAQSILELGLRDAGDKDFEVVLLGHDVHVKVTCVNSAGQIKIVGEEEYNDIAGQLVLACLHNLTAGDMAELSLKELNKEPPVPKKMEPDQKG